jgi:hypothetical protein
VGAVAKFLTEYIALPDRLILIIATWVVAAWLVKLWDRFPHLAITSPEKRCGKTRLLQLIECVTPNPYNTTNISPAALYRLIEQLQPTLLLDEAQSIARRGSEASEVLREILNAGIDREAKVIRCGGKNMNELQEFHVYCPKVIALIGMLDSVLADRCLAVEMKRKTEGDHVTSYRSRKVKPLGEELTKEIETWVNDHSEEVAKVYDDLEPFEIENDRMAELLLPLQAVLTVANNNRLPELEAYAFDLEKAEAEAQNQTPGVLLLGAFRDWFKAKPEGFIATEKMIRFLVKREGEPWAEWNRKPISATAIAQLLKPYGIKPDRKQKKVSGGRVITTRGYFGRDFSEAWSRYLPTPK